MSNRILLLLFFSFVVLTTLAQNISVDKNCLERNAVKFSQSLIDLKGEKYVSALLDKNISLLMFCSVDSLGHFCKINKITSKKKINRKFLNEIESKLINDSVSFFLCYEKFPGLNEDDSVEKLKEDLNSENKATYLINVSFPGYLMTLYNFESDKKKSQGLNLSKYQYLKCQIEKYQND